ncbi:SAM-dependent methyltransferase [Actinacidiphila rubida]|uniref:S-adenosyl methyltransferase n=1 Tax=Actinacidiphila rubida TaxID=310780 RepID=A0A1H8T1S6_9ACTN|nr:SAM-dependent methyltransferase [Actinacidiphila rubida]SEO84999.1 S-adenosyl methyltransferase [Actinacidiphila rubida]
MTDRTDQGFTAEEIDTSRPHPARMYDFYLGGRDNYEVDREAAQRVIDFLPDIIPAARANRDFLQRAVRYLTGTGIRQIIDIGTGIPTSPNTHEIAQAEAPDVRVAYVDNDPIVATHAGARLTGSGGNTGFFLADVRKPESILEHPTIGRLIDFDQPVALMLVAVLHFIKDEEDPAGIVAALRDALPAGSHLVLSHATADFHAASLPEVFKVYNKATATLNTRPYDEVVALFDGFELLDPGLVQVPLWRPATPPDPDEVKRIGFYGAVARKK